MRYFRIATVATAIAELL